MRISKKVGPVTVRASSTGGLGMSVGSKGTRISTSTRGKKSGSKAKGCGGVLLLFVVIALILAMCSPKDDKDDAPETEALSATETDAPETVSRSLPDETDAPETLPSETDPPETLPAEIPSPAPEEPATPVEEPAPAEEPAQTVTYIANTSTKKLHYSWCTSVADMKEENKMWVTEPEKMLEWGYTWCTRCHG